MAGVCVCVCTIIRGAVFDDELHALSELLSGRVQALPHVLTQRLQVHRPSDDLIIILHQLTVHRRVERVRLRARTHTHTQLLKSTYTLTHTQTTQYPKNK